MLVVYKPQTALSDGAGAATTMFHYLKRPLKRFLYKYLYNPESCFAPLNNFRGLVLLTLKYFFNKSPCNLKKNSTNILKRKQSNNLNVYSYTVSSS